LVRIDFIWDMSTYP